MKTNSPIFALLAPVLLWADITSQTVWAQQNAAFVGESGNRRAVLAADANSVIRQAAEAMAARPVFAAKLRQRIQMFGQDLPGSGLYLHQGVGHTRRLRMELRLQMGERVASMLQVCDGEHHWVYKELNGEPSVTRLDLEQIAAARLNAPPAANTAGFSLGLGGLPELLDHLALDWQFTSVTEIATEGQPLLQLEGQWNSAALARLLPDQAEAIAAGKAPKLRKLAQHIPDTVVVLLGQQDLVPYRIDFQRREPHSDDTYQRTDQSLVMLELLEVQLAPVIRPQEFIYEPGDESFADGTDAYLSARGWSE